MINLCRSLLILSFVLLGAGAACAQAAQTPMQGDAAAGARVAQRGCAACHALPGNERAMPDIGPTFLSIARDPQRTRGYITGWLMNPHPPMPNLSLTVREIADLAAYIESLKVQP